MNRGLISLSVVGMMFAVGAVASSLEQDAVHAQAEQDRLVVFEKFSRDT